LKLEDVIDHSIFEFLDRDYREKFQENINIAFTGKNTILETKNTFGNYYLNHFVPLAANNKEIMIIAIDITDRTKAEIKLKDSEEKFRNYVETSQDLMWECDAEGKFTYLNPAWEGVVGFTHDEMLGHAFSEFILPEEV
jgi:PAS domain-containing protein